MKSESIHVSGLWLQSLCTLPRTESARSVRRAFLLTIVAFVPFFADWGYKELVSPLPFWIHHYHTETLYYYSGWELLSGELPHNLDNPGTPVQLLSAGLVSGLGKNPARFPEFRRLGHILSASLTVLAGFLLIRFVFAPLSDTLSVCGVWIYFICSQSLEYAYVWSPEAFYFFVGSIFLIAFHKALRARYSRKWIFGAGTLLGLSCSIKFIFLAWVPAYLLALFVPAAGRSMAERISATSLGAIGIPAGFFASTFIVSSGYPYMFDWVLGLITRSGQYGSGESAGLDVHTILGNWHSAFLSSKGWHLLLFGFLAMILIGFSRKWKQGERLSPELISLLVFALTALAINYAFISRMFALRYLLPTGLCGIVLYLVAVRLWSERMTTSVQIGAVVVIGFLLAAHIVVDVRSHDARIATGRALHQQVDDLVSRSMKGARDPVVIYSFRFPQASFALRQSAVKEEFQTEIDELYPLQGHYIPWSKTLRLPARRSRWDFLVIREADLVDFPSPVGAVAGRVGTGKFGSYLVLASPDNG